MCKPYIVSWGRFAHFTNVYWKSRVCFVRKCRNLEMCLPLWFYVKSTLTDFRRSNTAIPTILEVLSFDSLGIWLLKMSKILKFQNGQNGTSKLISRKIWEAENTEIYTLWVAYKVVWICYLDSGKESLLIWNYIY